MDADQPDKKTKPGNPKTSEVKDDIEAADVDPSFAAALWNRYVWGGKADELGENAIEGAFGALLAGVSELSSQAVKFAAKKTLDTTTRVIKSTPEQMELIGKAGTSLKDMREVAGISIEELSGAIDLNDVDLLRSVEEGKAALPFEALLRLSSFYSRNDPIPFIMKYSRVYSPRVWKMLHAVGLDTLVVQAERELQFVQIYRRRDAARKLSEEGFGEVLDFTRKAFDMALHFVAEQEAQKNAVEDRPDVKPSDQQSR